MWDIYNQDNHSSEENRQAASKRDGASKMKGGKKSDLQIDDNRPAQRKLQEAMEFNPRISQPMVFQSKVNSSYKAKMGSIKQAIQRVAIDRTIAAISENLLGSSKFFFHDLLFY